MSIHHQEVVITGVGPVSAIGVGGDALWDAMASGRMAVSRRTFPLDVASTVDLPLVSMPQAAGETPGLQPHMDFLAEQGAPYRDLGYTLLAIELALKDAGLTYDRVSNRIGVIQAFEAPGVEHTVLKLLGMMSGPPPAGPPRVYDYLAPSFYNMQSFTYVHLVGKAFGFHGVSTSVHNACSSGAYALEVAAQQIRGGHADVMIVAGGEAFETAVRLEWFRRLELYAQDGHMQPFMAPPSGFYVGEGGAAIILESAAHARRRGASVQARYLGGAFAHQGWKQTIPDVRAARLSDVITRALATAGVAAGEIDLIVPHGAGTLLSDGYEAACLTQAIGGQAKRAVATVFKPYVGHLLGACGIMETICGLLALRNQAIPAAFPAGAGDTKLPVPLALRLTDHRIETMLKLSTGFTGHDAALVFARA